MDIEILGRITRVNCPPGQEPALQAAADELNRRLADMKAKSNVVNAEQLLAIAALNAFYELQNAAPSASDVQSAEEAQKMSEKLTQMNNALDEVLSK